MGPLVGLALLAASGCAERPPVVLGEGCELTIDCEAPLVCRLGACRNECRDARDCRAGLTCVRDAEGYGVCQLEDEAECSLNSDCPDGLVCRFNECTNACTEDRDCINGLSCVPDEMGTGELACRDLFELECQNHSDCGTELVCARDRRCRDECRTDRDCRDGRICEVGTEVCVLPNPLTRPTPSATFACGAATTCAVSAGGLELRCFGRNTSGEAGTGGIGSPALPANVLVGVSLVATDVGDRHACAISDALWCWGDGADGQLGLGSGTTTALAPTEVTMAAGAVGVATGSFHTCAWTPAELRCWGRNDRGQLGDGTIASRFEPGAPIDVGGAVVAVAGGEAHTCAVREDGTLLCWGDDVSGQVTGVPGDEVTTPHRSLVFDVVEVALGARHTCALRRDRAVRCWGDGSAGQTGDPAVTPAFGIVAPAGLGPVVQVTAGREHTCVREEDGTVKCFGAGGDGQLGEAPAGPDPFSASPLTVPLPSVATEVRAGHLYTCARLDDGTVYCFGANGDGQFGDTGAGGGAPRLATWF